MLRSLADTLSDETEGRWSGAELGCRIYVINYLRILLCSGSCLIMPYVIAMQSSSNLTHLLQIAVELGGS